MRMLGAIPTGALTQPPRFDSNDTFACPQPLEDDSPPPRLCKGTQHISCSLSPAWSARRLIERRFPLFLPALSNALSLLLHSAATNA